MNQTKIHSRLASTTNLPHTSLEERQLSRLNLRPEMMPPLTIKTYEDMIASRKFMFDEANTTS